MRRRVVVEYQYLRLATACMAILGLASCNDNAPSSTARSRPAAETMAVDSSSEHSTRKTTFSLGQKSYGLDVVICFGTSMATITASDSQQRSESPVVSIKIYDPAMSGGYSINTFSALFDNSEIAEHWILHEGIVEKSGNTITASGTLKGSLLLPNDDGTRRSMPMEEGGELPFEARIQC